MTTIFTTIGSAADYGTFGLCWAAQYASMALTSSADRWVLAMVIYIIGFVSYGATLVFYAAIFPRLARNTPHARHGEIPPEVYEQEESLEKNRISNISTVHSNIGYIITLSLNLALLLPIVTTYWVVLGIWWFVLQEPRPGPSLPEGEHYTTIGWKQIWAALKTYKHLPYTFVYLFSFFLLADGLNTTGTLVAICQNNKFQFSFLQNTYLGLSQAVTQLYWKIRQRRWCFVVTNVVTMLIPLWGMIGIGQKNLGWCHLTCFFFHCPSNMLQYHFLEPSHGLSRAYNIVFGLFQAPYYAFSQTMMAELSPPGFDNMFFGLFGLSNRASSMVGPNVIQGFPFLFALCTTASMVIWFGVDVTKGRREAARWAAEQRKHTR
ncbi:autophagy-related protein 22-like protein [Suillus spraguei]|nr:autophagy-related protein 22-like protein [Suillus spraguei]